MSYRGDFGSGMNHPRRHPFYEAFQDYKIHVRPPDFVDPPHGAFFGLDFGHGYYDDEVYTEEESDDEDHRKSYCGFAKNFLFRTPSTQPSLTQTHLCQQGLKNAKEKADRIAKELADEEQKSKDKAEKKRLKKMRQKERKRLEKLKESEKDVKSVSVEGGSKAEAALSKPESHPLDEKTRAQPPGTVKRGSVSEPAQSDDEGDNVVKEEDGPSDLEELDMTSTFVSKVQRKMELKPKPEKREKKNTLCLPKERSQEGQSHAASQNGAVSDVEDTVAKSLQLATMANSLASAGDYVLAVEYFTDAIKYNPTEYRLFGNRSFCYEKMQQYEKSLADAEISLTMCPNWIKGLYRKGRALTGVKRYGEALSAFKEVLKLDSSCTDAAQELMKVQIMQLMEMGFSREQSTNALIIYGTVEKALEVLSRIPDVTKTCQPVEEEWVVSEKRKTAQVPKNVPVTKPNSAVKTAPFKSQKQIELFPVWVGNLVPSITENMLQKLFGTTGEIHSIKVLPSRRCAFVNYTKKEFCEEAIKNLHAVMVEGSKLSVRYPDRIHSHLGGSKAAVTAGDVLSSSGQKCIGECFLWRGKGCHLKNCIFKHIPEHKGIDKGKGKVAT